MSLESLRAKSRRQAQEKVDEMKEAHDTEVVEVRKARRGAKLGSITLAATGVANLLDLVADYIPEPWEPYARSASVISATVAISGLASLNYHTDRAASKARIALAYAIPNEIALPQWTHPYILNNQDIFERNQIEVSSPQ